MAKALARKFNVPFVDLDQLTLNPQAFALVQPELIQKYQVLPLLTDKTSLTIALADPLAFEVIDLLRFSLGKRIVEMVATPSQIGSRIASLLAMVEAPITTCHSGRTTVLPFEGAFWRSARAFQRSSSALREEQSL